MEEHESDKLPPVVERKVARCQSYYETKTEHLKQYIDTLTELVSMLVATLGQNAAIVAPAIPLGIPLANAKGREALHPPSQ